MSKATLITTKVRFQLNSMIPDGQGGFLNGDGLETEIFAKVVFKNSKRISENEQLVITEMYVIEFVKRKEFEPLIDMLIDIKEFNVKNLVIQSIDKLDRLSIRIIAKTKL